MTADYLVPKDAAANAGDQTSPNYRDVKFTAHDGVTLYARDYGRRHRDKLPIVCLHGFSRNSKDFDEIAGQLAKDRRVIVPDLRGRGRSAAAWDWRSYTVFIELIDILDLLAALNIHQAVFFGTSRGGLIAVMAAAARPTVLAGVILNDIGPVVERQGLLRIAGQISNVPNPASWEDAATLVRKAGSHALPDLDDDAWAQHARRRYTEVDGRLVADFDPALARAFSKQSTETINSKITLWPQFAALRPFPSLLIHGALSEILSAETAAEMVKHHGNMKLLTIGNRGHVPLLNEPGVLEAAESLIAKAEKKRY